MMRILLASLLWGLVGCGHAQGPTPPSEETFELRAVVKERLAALEAQVPAPAPLPELGADDLEELEGLVTMGADPKFAEVAAESVREELGEGAIGPLVAILLDGTRTPRVRGSAAALLAALDDDRASRQLLEAAEKAGEPWLRRLAVYHLGFTSADWIVPRLLLRLKYEKDPETFIWLAATLGRFHNYSGLDALFDLSARGATEELRASAEGELERLAQEAGLSPEELNRRWKSAEALTLPQPSPSPALRLELWRRVASMGDETIQLRGVDDARFMLSRLGPWAAAPLSDALADEDLHLRLHVAQILARMGPRARSAGPALLHALAEPLLAPNAADALGRVGFAPARRALELRTSAEQPHELRVACVRALGRLGLPASLAVVRAAFAESEAYDLRMAAATALVLLDRGDEVAPWLRDELVEGQDAPSAELALETWLARGADRGRTGFSEALESWRAVQAAPPGVTPTLEQLAARRAQRAKELDLSRLLGDA